MDYEQLGKLVAELERAERELQRAERAVNRREMKFLTPFAETVAEARQRLANAQGESMRRGHEDLKEVRATYYAARDAVRAAQKLLT